MSTVTSFYDSGGQQQPPRRGLPPTGGSEGRVLAFIKCPSPLRMESRNLKNLLNTSSKKLSPRARRVGAVVVGHGPVEGGQSYYVHPRTPLREREGGSVTLRGKVGSTNTNTNTNNTGGGETEAKNNIGNRGNSTGSRVFPQVFREGGGAKNNIGTKNRGQSIGNKGGVSGGSGGSGNSKGIDKFYERHETEFRGEGKGEEVSTGRKDQHIAHPHAPKFAYGKPTLLNMLVSPLQIQRVSHNSQNPHNPPHDPPPNPPHKKNAKRAANPNREPPEPRGKKMSSNRGEVSKSLPPTYPGDIYSHHIFAQPHLPYTPIVQRPGDQLPNSHSFLVGAPEYFTHHQLGPHRSETQTQNVSSETGNFRTLPAHGVSSSDAATSQAISQIGCMPPMHIMSNENIPERREETIGEVEEETGPVQRTGVYHCYAASSGSGISGMAGYSIPSIHSQGVGTGSSLQVGSPLDKHRGVVAQGKGIVGAVGAVGGVGAVRRSSDNCIPPRGHDNYNYVPQGQSPKSIEREGQITNTTRTQKSRQQHPTKVVSYGGSVGNSPDKEEDMEIPMQMNVNISKTPNQQMEGVTLDDVSPPIDTQGPPPPLEKETGIPAPQKYDQYLVHNYIKGHGLKGSHRDKAPKPQNPLPPGTPEKKTYDLDTLCKPMSRGLAGQKITTRLFLASAVRGQIRNQHEHRNSNPPNFLELNQKISQGAGPETQESFSVTPQLGRTGLMTTGGSNMNMGSTDKGSISNINNISNIGNIKNQNHIKTESSPHRKWEQLHQDLISKHSQRKTLESAGVQGSSISRRGSTLTTDTTYKFPYSNRPNYTKVTTKKLELNLPYPPGKGLQGMPMSLRMSGILNQTVYGGEELRGGLVLLPRGMETDGQWGSDPLNSIGTPRVAPNQLSFTGASKYHHHTPNRGETAHSQRDSKKDTIIHVGSVKVIYIYIYILTHTT